jgi:hypothetical protein
VWLENSIEDPAEPPAVVHLANSSPFIAPSLLRTFQVQFMPPWYPHGCR